MAGSIGCCNDGARRMPDAPADCLPDYLPCSAPASVLAMGAFLKNRACLIEGDHVFWSPEHGELNEVQACLALETSVDQLFAQAAGIPLTMAHDLHPDFYSTHLATRTAKALGVASTAVQHHHAHIAASVAQLGIAHPVIGIALDGFGLGSDDSAWGGELLWVDGGRMAHHWCRLSHLQPMRLPGADMAVKQPWRLAAALLHDVGRGAEIEERFAPLVGQQSVRIVSSMLDRSVNCPSSTSAGRWFDLAAASLGLCTEQQHEGEAAQELERRASRYLHQQPHIDDNALPFHLFGPNEPGVPGEPGKPSDHATDHASNISCKYSLDLRDIVTPFLDVDRADSSAIDYSAALFHIALASKLANAAAHAAHEHRVQDVVLSGGCLVNQILRQRLTDALQQSGLRVHVPEKSICGDTALALGQAWVAACSLEN